MKRQEQSHHKRNRIHITIIICLLLGSVLLAGCKKPSKGNQVTLKTVSMFGGTGADAEYYQDLLEKFQEGQPDVTIADQSETSTEEWKKATVESFNTEEEIPDVLFYFTGADARKLILDNKFVTLEEIKEQYPEYGKNIRPSAMEYVREFDGNFYSVPVRGFWEGIFCNKDLFDLYGLELPYDWNSFLQAIDTFRANQVTPIAASFKEIPHYWIEHLILAEGGSVEHSLNPYQYVPDSWIKGLSQFQELQNRSAFTDQACDIMNADAIQMFADKKAAMLLEGSWTAGSVQDPQTTAVVPFPSTPDGKKDPSDIISGYSTGYYITRKAWEDPIKRDAAVRFVSMMTSNESIAYICKAGGAPAADITSSGDSTLLLESSNELQKNSEKSIMPVDSRLSKEAWQYLCTSVPGLVKGGIAPAKVMEEISNINKW